LKLPCLLANSATRTKQRNFIAEQRIKFRCSEEHQGKHQPGSAHNDANDRRRGSAIPHLEKSPAGAIVVVSTTGAIEMYGAGYARPYAAIKAALVSGASCGRFAG
jgi:hypothetical protein